MSEVRRVSVWARGDEAEPLRALLLELVPSGFEERDDGGRVELAAYVPPGRAAELLAVLPDATVSEVDDGWEDAWRRFHQPATAGGLWLGPPWEVAPEPGRAVVIDPGRAFGTGAHPTTRLCVELLARTDHPGSLLDIGCGSGVLSIAAIRLGFAPVIALDDDPVAVETTRANAAANGVGLEVRLADALSDPLPQVDVAVANILLEPVEKALARLDAAEAITSGYLAAERPAHPGWAHVETLELDGWAAARFTRA